MDIFQWSGTAQCYISSGNLDHTDMYGYPWISMDILGYIWIYMGLQGNISNLLYWIRYPFGYPNISIHIHTYPWKIFKDIHILYPKSISLHYPCCYPSRYPFISIFHFAYPCVFKWDLRLRYTYISTQYIHILTN